MPVINEFVPRPCATAQIASPGDLPLSSDPLQHKLAGEGMKGYIADPEVRFGQIQGRPGPDIVVTWNGDEDPLPAADEITTVRESLCGDCPLMVNHKYGGIDTKRFAREDGSEVHLVHTPKFRIPRKN